MNIKDSLDVRNLAGNCRAAACLAVRGRGGVFSVFTGTAANLLGPGQLLPLFEAVICAGSAHLNVDECGAGSGSGRQAADSGRRRTGS